MRKETYNQSEWLKDITKDQNIENLDHITLTRWDGLRRWFASRILQPTFDMGYYDTSTGSIVLGVPTTTFSDLPRESEIDTSTTSAATYTLTCPAGHRYVVTACGYSNGTRVTAGQLELTKSGGAAKILLKGTTAGLATYVWKLIGAYNSASNAAGFNSSIEGPIILGPGDVLTIRDNSFVAADTMYYYFMYQDVVL